MSRRERQIMEALYRLGKASAAEIRDAIPEPPTNTAVRTHLTILLEKGRIRYEKRGARFIYEPVVSRDDMAKSAIETLLTTFFDNSIERAVATLINREEANISDAQLDSLAAIIEQARREGR